MSVVAKSALASPCHPCSAASSTTSTCHPSLATASYVAASSAAGTCHPSLATASYAASPYHPCFATASFATFTVDPARYTPLAARLSHWAHVPSRVAALAACWFHLSLPVQTFATQGRCFRGVVPHQLRVRNP